MHTRRWFKSTLSSLVVLALLIVNTTAVFATTPLQEGGCAHVCTDGTCSYAEPSDENPEGAVCDHVCDENCGGLPAVNPDAADTVDAADNDVVAQEPVADTQTIADALAADADMDVVYVSDYAGLQPAIDAAGTKKTTIVLTKTILLEATIKIGAGQDITLKDDPAAINYRSIYAASNVSLDRGFEIAEGGTLTLDTGMPEKLTGYRLYFSGKIGEKTIETLFYCEGTLNINHDTVGILLCGSKEAIIITGENAALNMKGGKISNNTISKSGGVISIINGATFTMDGGIIYGNTATRAYSGVIYVADGSHFTMNGGDIGSLTNNRYNDFENQHGGIIYIKDGSDFTMNGGSIANNNSRPNGAINNSVIYIEAAKEESATSTFTLNEGTITKNQSHNGTVLVGLSPSRSQLSSYAGGAKMVMNGGTISENTARDAGGGVFVTYQGDFKMNGGKIIDNTVEKGQGFGGGVATYDYLPRNGDYAAWSKKYPASFVLDGGTINGNSAGNAGGGVYIASSGVVLKSGEIKGNKSVRQGGGVYVSTVPYVLHMYDALITENTATAIGGGLWFCPTGDAHNAVTNGGAIFDNKAGENNAGKGTAGADFVVQAGMFKGYYVTLADRMLGGGQVKWHKDGAVDAFGTVNASVPRFDPANPGDRIENIKDSFKGYALVAQVSDAAKALAKGQAKLIITDNKSAAGGGVGSNGSIIIGTAEDDWNLKVIKAWAADVSQNDRKEVKVYLKIGDYVLDYVTLNAGNNWTDTFKELPDPDSLGNLKITVVEEKGTYDASYSDLVKTDDENTLSITVTNSLPTIPHYPDPDEPDPDEPDEPDEPDWPTSPSTGESATLWTMAAMLAAMAMVYLVVIGIKHRREN